MLLDLLVYGWMDFVAMIGCVYIYTQPQALAFVITTDGLLEDMVNKLKVLNEELTCTWAWQRSRGSVACMA